MHCNKNLYSTATSVKQPQSASCRPKGDFLFYTTKKQPVVSSPEWLLFRGLTVIYRQIVDFVIVTSVYKT